MGPARVSGGGHHSTGRDVGTQAAKRRSNPTQRFSGHRTLRKSSIAMLRLARVLKCDAAMEHCDVAMKFIIQNS